MSATFESLRPASSGNKSFWPAVCVLVVAALALGAALIHIQTQPEDPQFEVLSVFAPASAPPRPEGPMPLTTTANVLKQDAVAGDAAETAVAPASTRLRPPH